MTDVYDKIEASMGFIWSWPNRSRDLNFYKELPPLGGWDHKWLWDVDDLGVVGYQNDPVIARKCEKMMKVVRRTWLESERTDQSSALAWHLALRRLSVWPGYSMEVLTFPQLYEAGWEASGELVFSSFYDIWECQRFVLNGLVRQFVWVDHMERTLAGGGTVADLAGISASDLHKIWVRLDDCMRLWDGSYVRKDGWKVEMPSWVRSGVAVGFGSSWREFQCFVGIGLALVPMFDRFDSVSTSKRERRSSHLLRSICDGMFAKYLPACNKITQSAGLLEV